jgi:hypothetical protein
LLAAVEQFLMDVTFQIENSEKSSYRNEHMNLTFTKSTAEDLGRPHGHLIFQDV